MPGITAHICYTLNSYINLSEENKRKLYSKLNDEEWEEFREHTKGPCKEWKIWNNRELLQSCFGKMLAASILPDVLKDVYGIKRKYTHYCGDRNEVEIEYKSLDELRKKLPEQPEKEPEIEDEFLNYMNFDEIENDRRFDNKNTDIPEIEKFAISTHLKYDKAYSLSFQKESRELFEKYNHEQAKKIINDIKYKYIKQHDAKGLQKLAITPNQLESIKNIISEEYKGFPDQEKLNKFLEWIKWPENLIEEEQNEER